jgi:hypothetical protein
LVEFKKELETVLENKIKVNHGESKMVKMFGARKHESPGQRRYVRRLAEGTFVWRVTGDSKRTQVPFR